MRITFIQIVLFLLITTMSYAEPSEAQELLKKKINLSIDHKSLKEVLKTLASQNKLQFVYSQDIISSNNFISISADNETLDQILDKMFTPYHIKYQIIKDKIVLSDDDKGAPGKQSGQTITDNQIVPVSGKVSDETKQPLIGVSVKVKGTNVGTQTDLDGNYTLNIPDKTAVLIFSYIGFNTQEIEVNGRTNVSVQMKAQANSLSEVVVVGYGTQKRSDVTGAVASANLEDFRNAPNTNIAQSLQGTVPGLNVGQVNSAGSTPPISIRGTNTISGNASVLIVLDGIQYNGSLESINPDDIASIDVLKDASSTAVYGAQAANGVLLITSRKGKKNQNPRISFSSSYATQTPTGNLRPLNRQEFIDHVRDLYYNEAYLAPDYTQTNPAFNVASRVDASMVDASGNILNNDYNWYNAATHTGHIIDNQLSVSGGGDKFTYLLSGNMTDQSGFIKNDLFKRKGIRVNMESQATSWLKLGLQSFGSFVNKDGAEPSLANIIRSSPLVVPYDASGNLIPYPTNSTFSNPFLGYAADDYERHNYFFANIYTEINFPFVKGLTYRLNFGNNYRINQHNSANVYGAGLSGEAYKNFENYYDYTLDNILTYARTFNKHDITATLLYGSIQRSDSYTNADATAFSRLTLGYNSLEQGTNQFTSSDAWKEALEYQMARLNYKYDNKYLLTTTIRRDGFSGFAANHKFGYFPSVALGWIVTNESFFKLDWVDNLKVRVGYGVSGNQTSRYFSLARVSSGASYVFGDGGGTLFGQQVQSLANPDLRWERTAGINAGVDFTLFKGALLGSFDYYNNDTRDLLFSVNIPVITGFGSINTNVGELRNKGLELTLTSKNLQVKDFRWSTTFNFSRNVNRIVKLVGLDANHDGQEDDLVASNLFIGHSINSYYDYKSNGIYQIGETIPSGYSPGTYRVIDQNGDGVITSADRIIIGNRDPSFRTSMLNTFEYKNFSLGVFLNSIIGFNNNYIGEVSQTITRSDNTVRYNYLSAIDYWSPTNPGGKYSSSIVASTISPGLYQNRTFLRLQDVSLSYRFTGKLISRLKLQNLSLYASGKNLATWTKWEGWDPETNQGLSIDGRPVLKGYSFGINATF